MTTVDYDALTVAQLAAEAEARGLQVDGTGTDGNVLKQDLVDALRADDESAPTVVVRNLTGLGISVPGFGLLGAGAVREVPDSPPVRELLDGGALAPAELPAETTDTDAQEG